MTPSEAITSIGQGKLLPVYLIVGEEHVLVDRVIASIKKAVLQGGMADFNFDAFDASETSVSQVLDVAQTLPMMAPRRFVLVRGVEAWENKAEKVEGKGSASPTGALADYMRSPNSSTCLVMTATKLDKRRKISVTARKLSCIVSCESLKPRQLPGFIEREAKSMGHPLGRGVSDMIAEAVGPDLAPVLDALERLSLYVGPKQPIEEKDVAACITRVRVSSVWDLVEAVANKDVARALDIVADVYDPRDSGLPLIGAMAWSTRQLLRFTLARRAGADVKEAAQQSGVQPFNVRRVVGQTRRLSVEELERWLRVLAEADRRLKSSRMKPLAILESTILTLTTGVPM